MHLSHHDGGGAGPRGRATLSNETPYAKLSPDLVLDAVGACGLWPDGRLLALNSYENRVWQVGLEDSQPVIAKFYRPNRWSNAAIVEEHAFTLELAAAELPVVAPLVFADRTLLLHNGFRYALTGYADSSVTLGLGVLIAANAVLWVVIQMMMTKGWRLKS